MDAVHSELYKVLVLQQFSLGTTPGHGITLIGHLSECYETSGLNKSFTCLHRRSYAHGHDVVNCSVHCLIVPLWSSIYPYDIVQLRRLFFSEIPSMD